jgi:hypothetical protein
MLGIKASSNFMLGAWVFYVGGSGEAQSAGQRLAQAASTTTVCWGEFDTTCKLHPYDTFIKCGAGGNAGFSNIYVCQTICNKPQGGGCTLQLNNQQSENACGYAWVTVRCFNN